MEQINNEVNNNNEENIEQKRGRKPNPDAISKQVDYYKNYYHTAKLGIVILCPKCNNCITKQKLKRHLQSRRCKIIF